MLSKTADLSGHSNLDVKASFASSVTAMEKAGRELKALPQNPDGPKIDHDKALSARLDKVGAREGTDMAMFLLGGIQAATMGLATGAAGFAAGGMAAQGAEIALGMATERAEEKTRYAPVAQTTDTDTKADAKRKPTATRVFKPANTRSFGQVGARAAAPAGATSMLMAASTRQARNAYKAAEPKRKKLEAELSQAESMAQVMNFYKSGDVYAIYDGADGQKVQGKARGTNQERLAHGQAVRKMQHVPQNARRFAASAPTMAARM